MKNILSYLIIGLLLLAACTTTTTPPEPTPAEPTTPQEPGATYGDLVTIDFVLYFENGTVADTNNAQLAKEAKLTNYVKGPFTFILGQSDKVPGFDETILGMHEGEHKEAWIEPSEHEVIVNISKTKALKRFLAVDRYQKFPRSRFEEFFKKPPVIGDIVLSDMFAFKYQVVNMTNKTVLTKMVLKEGEEYVLPNTEWTSKVAKVANDDALFFQMPEENQTIDTPFGPAVINFTPSAMFINFQPELNKIFNRSIDVGGFQLPAQFQITDVGETYFTIKRYGALTDKRLKLVVDMISVTPEVKKVKQDKLIVNEIVGGIDN